jgi:N-acetylglucosaminyldiphosphoundecaprenol N-acetyl-beta-D-mannosaminyltransferase
VTTSEQELEDRAEAMTRSTLLAELEDGFSNGGIRHRKRAQYRRALAWTVAVRAAGMFLRVVDVMFAFVLLLIVSPVFVCCLIVARSNGGGVRKKLKLGRWATHFYKYELYFPDTSFFSRLTLLHDIPAFYNILKGEMAFIGPRAVSLDEMRGEGRVAWRRYDVRPGLLGLWWIRKRANIAYASEQNLDLEYVETKTFWGDLGIAARAIPTVFLGQGGGSSAPAQIKFLGVRIDNLTMAEASAQIVCMAKAETPSQVCFVNADCVNTAVTDEQYLETLSSAQLVLADGIGVRLAGSILNQNVRENVNGTDMLPHLCQAVEAANLGVYLMGGRSGVAEAAASWMTDHYPRLEISGFHDGYFTEAEEPELVAEIKASGASILLVALGAPRQDKWIALHQQELGVKVAIGVGGLLDFYSGRIQRAPVWMRELGMEWFYRFSQEPRRMWRRYFLGNAVFLFRVVRERMRARRFQQGRGTF